MRNHAPSTTVTLANVDARIAALSHDSDGNSVPGPSSLAKLNDQNDGSKKAARNANYL